MYIDEIVKGGAAKPGNCKHPRNEGVLYTNVCLQLGSPVFFFPLIQRKDIAAAHGGVEYITRLHTCVAWLFYVGHRGIFLQHNKT